MPNGIEQPKSRCDTVAEDHYILNFANGMELSVKLDGTLLRIVLVTSDGKNAMDVTVR